MINNLAAECSILLKFSIEYDHVSDVTPDVQQTFKVKG